MRPSTPHSELPFGRGAPKRLRVTPRVNPFPHLRTFTNGGESLQMEVKQSPALTIAAPALANASLAMAKACRQLGWEAVRRRGIVIRWELANHDILCTHAKYHTRPKSTGLQSLANGVPRNRVHKSIHNSTNEWISSQALPRSFGPNANTRRNDVGPLAGPPGDFFTSGQHCLVGKKIQGGWYDKTRPPPQEL
ncbi:hypothetical protein R1flu_027988 [Riccia fluitans]|uniref:Uncharacterized protein n=1 Tax=Riccia fluitans TaxID=41844 RepID=A0ABD1XKV8_9MARC